MAIDSQTRLMWSAIKSAFDGQTYNPNGRVSTRTNNVVSGIGGGAEADSVLVTFYGWPEDIPSHLYRVADRYDRTVSVSNHRMGGTGRHKTILSLEAK
jgi:hypothetical protein